MQTDKPSLAKLSRPLVCAGWTTFSCYLDAENTPSNGVFCSRFNGGTFIVTSAIYRAAIQRQEVSGEELSESSANLRALGVFCGLRLSTNLVRLYYPIEAVCPLLVRFRLMGPRWLEFPGRLRASGRLPHRSSGAQPSAPGNRLPAFSTCRINGIAPRLARSLMNR